MFGHGRTEWLTVFADLIVLHRIAHQRAPNTSNEHRLKIQAFRLGLHTPYQQ